MKNLLEHAAPLAGLAGELMIGPHAAGPGFMRASRAMTLTRALKAVPHLDIHAATALPKRT